ncbi:MAG TPA: FGGY-family carbohydrate kinase [Acidimicrobiales bacterium]|nr:FGGY-family carbohydrate kinase [Acidimicrobiales bacterium]
MADVTVGVDIGTTSVKAVAVNSEGEVLARARVPHAISTPEPGSFEHDVDQAWRANVVTAYEQVAGGRDVAAVDVSAMVPSLGAVDATGHGVGPGLLYGDRRGERLGNDTTQPGDSGELLAFLAWHARNTPDAAGFWPAQATANHALCGVAAIDSTTAMTAHPLFDYTGWDEARAKEAGASVDQLPQIVAGYGAVGSTADGALVGGGTIDAFAEQLCAGADNTGDVLVLCGTTLITWGVIEAEGYVDGLWTIPHTAPGKLMIGGPSNAGGLWLETNKRWLAPVEPPAVAAVDPSDLPVWLPYVRGERTPLHRRDIRTSLHGASLQHGAAHLRRAAYEASAFVVRHHVDLGRGAGLAPTRIVATGGGTRDDNWMQALADCTGLPVDVSANPEGAALGGAFIARCVAGLERSTRDAARWARTARTVEPRAHDAIEERYARFRALTDSL